jgi:hypothetical protein
LGDYCRIPNWESAEFGEIFHQKLRFFGLADYCRISKLRFSRIWRILPLKMQILESISYLRHSKHTKDCLRNYWTHPPPLMLDPPFIDSYVDIMHILYKMTTSTLASRFWTLKNHHCIQNYCHLTIHLLYKHIQVGLPFHNNSTRSNFSQTSNHICCAYLPIHPIFTLAHLICDIKWRVLTLFLFAVRRSVENFAFYCAFF